MPTRNSKTTENPAISLSWPVRVKQAAKVTFAHSKHRTVQSIMNPPEKKRIRTSSILAWGKRGVALAPGGFSDASKSCPGACVEIALTFWLRNTRDISCRSNSKRLAPTAELKFEFTSAISEFRIILSRSFWLRANENGINNIVLQLIDRHQSTSPKTH